ncbi:MAG: hypothetical protein QMC77_08975, partial [Methanocellales archaeon]|nr:hypothetical protein [Methanocellales archaeon]
QQPPAKQHPDKVNNPYTCWECHNDTSKPYANVSNALNVTEHFKSGYDIRAVTGAANNTSSCLSCHNKTEMMMAYTEPDTHNTTLSLVSHYGKKRSELRTYPGGSTNCSYCHQNESVFPFVDDELRELKNHTSRATNPSCVNSTCHDEGWIHNATLDKPTVDHNLCQACHADRYRHNGTLECYECHGNATNKIHPILYLRYDNTTSTSNASAVNCTTCHQSTSVDGSLSLAPPKISAPMHHSEDELNGSKWNTSYW